VATPKSETEAELKSDRQTTDRQTERYSVWTEIVVSLIQSLPVAFSVIVRLLIPLFSEVYVQLEKHETHLMPEG
jgi:hypothetical protein